jgi:hypothetical protein
MQQLNKFIIWRLSVAQHVSGRFLVHHQELTTALAASGFTVGESGGWSVVGRGLAGYNLPGYNLPDHDQQRCYRHSLER